MKIRSVVALVGLAISLAVPTFAQQANDVVGAWTPVLITLEKDGKKTDFYGPNPQRKRTPFRYFGTYTVSETDKTISYHIESSTFPNWNGAARKASFNISGDELGIQVISGPLTRIGTGTAYAVWKRAK